MQFNKVYSFLNRIVSIKEDTSKGIIKYDSDNLFPQNLIRKVSESGTATNCIEALNQYIYADGLVDKELGDVKVNSSQTLNQLIKEETPYVSLFSGVAYHVSRKLDGSISEIKIIPFELLRKSTRNTIIFNSTYSLNGKYDSSKNVEYPIYRGVTISPNEVKEHILEYGVDKGEILYFFNKKPSQTHYPIPSYYASISDIDTDAELSKYELESVNNSFLPSGILTLIGKINNVVDDETGRSEQDEINDLLSGFTGSVKDSKGESGRNKLLVLNAKTKDEVATYQSLNSDGVLSASDLATKRISEKVARAFGVPPFLIGLGGAVGFSTNIISDNIALFNNRVTPYQDIICDSLKLFFPEKNIELTKFTPLKYIQPEVLAKLTDSELRELGGYKTDETKANSSVSLAQTLGIGGTQSLISILQDSILTPKQKINTLMILFNVSEENAKKLIENGV